MNFTHTFTMTFNALTPPVLFSPSDFNQPLLPAPVPSPIPQSSASASHHLLTAHARHLPPLFGRFVHPRLTSSGIYIDNGLRATKKTVRIARDQLGPTPNLDLPFNRTTEQSTSRRLITQRCYTYSASNRSSFDLPGASSPLPKPLTKMGRIMLKRKLRLRAKFEEHKRQKAERAAARSRLLKVVGVVAAGAIALGCMAARWFF